jgi:hypothetical protein
MTRTPPEDNLLFEIGKRLVVTLAFVAAAAIIPLIVHMFLPQ